MKSELVLENISKSYKKNRALKRFSATMTDGKSIREKNIYYMSNYYIINMY
ncbi:MAG: hypothetical protein IJK34_09915 [Clostridia bacterium]|nr:hypothetical protein [Clostridia bacterium]